MKTIKDLDSIIRESRAPGISLFYFSRPACGVCGAIRPKVVSLLEEFPEIRSFYVDLDEVPEAAGQLSILTIPAVLVFAEGGEVVREARYMSMDDLREKIARPYSFIYGS